jgi:hypothetical protein
MVSSGVACRIRSGVQKRSTRSWSATVAACLSDIGPGSACAARGTARIAPLMREIAVACADRCIAVAPFYGRRGGSGRIRRSCDET